MRTFNVVYDGLGFGVSAADAADFQALLDEELDQRGVDDDVQIVPAARWRPANAVPADRTDLRAAVAAAFERYIGQPGGMGEEA